MKLEVLQTDFGKSLNLASRFTSTNSQLPVLTNLFLHAQKTKLFIVATNLEMSVSTSIGAKVTQEGEITVPVKAVVDIVNNLSLGKITIESKNERLKINSEAFKGTVLGINAADFPTVPQQIGERKVDLSKDDLLTALSKVLFVASNDETRPILTGVLFVFKGKELFLVATDGFRLSRLKIKLPQSMGETEVVLPKTSLSEFVRAFDKSLENISLELLKNDNQAVIEAGKSVFSTRILEGNFPDYEKIIPTKTNIKIDVAREDLLKAVKLAAVYAREAANTLKLQIKKGKLSVVSESSQVGKQETAVDAKIDGGEGDFEIAYNYRFLEEFLNIASGENVVIEFVDTNSPGIFRDPQSPDFLHLIMPVKVGS